MRSTQLATGSTSQLSCAGKPATRDFSAIPPGDPGDYRARSDEELLQILDHIDAERAGDRYPQLINAIRQRVDEQDP
jgi:hypothetical protein